MAGHGSALAVIQEWWGLVPHIEDIVDRFAKEGFLAIAPDLYHGQTATSPDEAKRLRMEMDIERAEREIAGAGEYLLQHPDCTSKTYGVIGFCMGGALAQFTASREKNVAAAVSFYGGFKTIQVNWDGLSSPLLLIYGERDESVPVEQGRDLAKKLKEMGKNVELKIYPGADHAFFNDTRPQVYKRDAAEDAWRLTLDFFRRYL